MTTVADVLPANSQAYEQAAAAGVSDTLPIPIDTILDPGETPQAFLPFLAAHESVDLWYDDWSIERKRSMVADAVELAALKGTREGLRRFLAYVDAEITWLIAHPARFVFGRSAVNVRPIAHRPLTAHYLIKVPLAPVPNPFQVGRAAIGKQAMTRVSLELIHRAKTAMVVAKATETLTSANFAWRRRARFGDALPLDGTTHFGQFIDRPRL
jgi:phage tail P2-like protein